MSKHVHFVEGHVSKIRNGNRNGTKQQNGANEVCTYHLYNY